MENNKDNLDDKNLSNKNLSNKNLSNKNLGPMCYCKTDEHHPLRNQPHRHYKKEDGGKGIVGWWLGWGEFKPLNTSKESCEFNKIIDNAAPEKEGYSNLLSDEWKKLVPLVEVDSLQIIGNILHTYIQDLNNQITTTFSIPAESFSTIITSTDATWFIAYYYSEV